ncbi:Linear gramicidin synthase subunit D [Vibrio ruber DSM 16370]|uniref:Linear gramicidin synthase subunit D n=1 Tax=Vibrio ruber (strain DSM 16370 / JCM 11486 / BCRC 17186 / CECT 7878 / LMG 23124 / VR1) TaxID=1123498 RepID=A0A1R4LRH8_VIBR1|nr:non-ribosomal peptide synthetase [Vibrio ruber]SJN59053.1 Linear gramicidin synthase subunit D [Vibrio ruber DSM 16370]
MIQELFDQLIAQEVELWLDGDRLRYQGPDSAITQELLHVLRENKPELISCLKKYPEKGLIRYPLSYSQKSLWVIYQQDPESPAYNVTLAISLVQDCDLDDLHRAVRLLVQRHASLRTIYIESEGNPVQVVQRQGAFEWNIESAEAQTSQLLEHWIAEKSDKPFDLSKTPLRFDIRQDASDSWTLVMTVHHIAADFWSLEIMMRELMTLYQAVRNEGTASLPALPYQYHEWVEKEQRWLASSEGHMSEAFWLHEMSGGLPVVHLPTDKPRPARMTRHGNICQLTIDSARVKQIRSLSKSYHATPFVCLLTVFQVLLQRFTNQNQLVIGIPTAGRIDEHMNNVVGHFVNTVVFKSELNLQERFGNLVEAFHVRILNLMENQGYPFPKLVEQLNPERDSSRSPIFQIMYNWNQTHDSIDKRGLTSDYQHLIEKILYTSSSGGSGTTHDLVLTVTDEGEQFQCSWLYNSDLFEVSTIERMAASFLELVDEVIARPENSLCDYEIMPGDEREKILQLWNQNVSAMPSVTTIHEWVEKQVDIQPESVAVKDSDGKSYSYRTLNQQANQLARYLREQGADEHTYVGVFLERSFDMLVGMLAILKAGAAYVPLDPAYPENRLAAILDDSSPVIVLSQLHLKEKLEFDLLSSVNLVIAIDDSLVMKTVSQFMTTNLNLSLSADALSHIIFTSGSTGRPKGVMIQHQNVIALLDWAQREYQQTDLSGVLAATSICFDLSVYEIFFTLISGGTIILVEDALQLPESPWRESVTLINSVPSAVTALLQHHAIPESVKIVNLAGEPLVRHLVGQLYALSHIERVYNLYGPSEDTTYSTYEWVPRDEKREPTIGRPINNTSAYILNADLKPVPVGVSGELYLGGSGVSLGYLHRPDLTDERFIPDRWSHQKGKKLYKTGDLVRYLPDGRIEYLGRSDFQVKIRGYRIELGEIESVMRRLDHILDVVVVAKTDGQGNSHLVAYVILSVQLDSWQEGIRHHLYELLPKYMVPSLFFAIDEFPLAQTGKVDRQKLSAMVPESGPSETVYTAPSSALEQELAEIWQQVLGKSEVGIYDNFFASGGDSIIALKVVSRMRQSGYSIAMKDLFEYQSIAELAYFISEYTTVSMTSDFQVKTMEIPDFGYRVENYVDIGKVDSIESVYPLASLQDAFLQELGVVECSTVERLIVQYIAELDKINVQALKQAWDSIVQRHDILRTSFLMSDSGEKLQLVHQEVVLPFQELDWSNLEQSEQEQSFERWLDEDRHSGFFFEKAPLLRVQLIRFSTSSFKMIWSFHHALLDGWSVDIIKRELVSFYDQFASQQQPDVTLGYPYYRYIQWLRDKVADQKDSRKYWQDYLAGKEQYTPYPALMKPSADDQNSHDFLPAYHTVELLDLFCLNQLESFARTQQVTLNVIFQAAWALLLRFYSNEDDVLFSTVVAGRPSELDGCDQMVGSFFQALPVRIQMSSHYEKSVWLKALHLNQISMEEHKYVGPMVIQDCSQLPENTHYSSQTILVFQKFSEETSEVDSLNSSHWLHRQPGASLLHISLIPQDETIQAYIRYDRNSYSPESLNKIMEKYKDIISILSIEGVEYLADTRIFD